MLRGGFAAAVFRAHFLGRVAFGSWNWHLSSVHSFFALTSRHISNWRSPHSRELRDKSAPRPRKTFYHCDLSFFFADFSRFILICKRKMEKGNPNLVIFTPPTPGTDQAPLLLRNGGFHDTLDGRGGGSSGRECHFLKRFKRLALLQILVGIALFLAGLYCKLMGVDVWGDNLLLGDVLSRKGGSFQRTSLVLSGLCNAWVKSGVASSGMPLRSDKVCAADIFFNVHAYTELHFARLDNRSLECSGKKGKCTAGHAVNQSINRMIYWILINQAMNQAVADLFYQLTYFLTCSVV